MTLFVLLFIRGVIRKSYRSDIKYHVTLDIVFSVAGVCQTFHMWKGTPLVDNKRSKLCEFFLRCILLFYVHFS